jgi:hypothetical protein
MSVAPKRANTLPPLCYIRHVTTSATIMVQRCEIGSVPVDPKCSPECLNSRLPRVPTEDEIAAMRHGSVMGWQGPVPIPSSGVGVVTARRERRRPRAKEATVDNRRLSLLLGPPALRGPTAAIERATSKLRRRRPGETKLAC